MFASFSNHRHKPKPKHTISAWGQLCSDRTGVGDISQREVGLFFHLRVRIHSQWRAENELAVGVSFCYAQLPRQTCTAIL